MFNFKNLWLMLLGLLTAAFIFFRVIAPVEAQFENSVTSNENRFEAIYQNVSPSVVAINVVAQAENPQIPNPFNPNQTPDREVRGSGSGFVIDTAGHILTNHHVVDNATEIEVYFVDGTLARADVVGLDPDSDLAVIQVDLPQDQLSALQPVSFGDSSALHVGETVLAIGSPFGQRWTLTSGIVSALDRTIQGLTDFSIGGVIQTDAAINPGNSGGPLLNLAGQVIGVNSQIISESHSNAGIGFAIPSNLAQRVAQDLIEQGYVSYSYLGIRGGNVNLAVIEAYDLANNTQGVVVAEVSAGSPAARAGLQNATFADDNETPVKLDIITAINGQSLRSMNDLISYLATNTKPSDEVTLTVLRDGTETLELTVRLTPRP